MEPKSVRSLQLLDDIKGRHVPNFGALKGTIDDKLYPGVEMVLSPSGVYVTHKAVNFFIPMHCISYVVFA